MSKRFLLTLLTLAVLAVAGIVAAYIAKGYRVSPETRTIVGTGILSVTSIPDQASVYLDNALITATNANINSLEPKEYTVRIVKEGFIPWEKKISVNVGLVTDIKATLFPALPSIYPLTFNGVEKPILSEDSQNLAFIVPGREKKSGVWVWTMKDAQIGFARGGEPHQIMLPPTDVSLSEATLSWSLDSKQVLVSVSGRNYLLEQSKLNDPPRDITPILPSTLKTWEEDAKALKLTKIQTIKDLNMQKIASNSAYLKFSPDETKFIYSEDGKSDFKSVDIKLNKTYDLPASLSYAWLPTSLHFLLVDLADENATLDEEKIKKGEFPSSKISIVEFEGTNKSEIFIGNFDPLHVFPWPDASRVVMVYSLPTPTASRPNMYGVNLK